MPVAEELNGQLRHLQGHAVCVLEHHSATLLRTHRGVFIMRICNNYLMFQNLMPHYLLI
jgi:hypothetical protein